MLPGLEVLEHYPYECTEQSLSRFLPNLEAYRAVQELGLSASDLESRLDRTLQEGIQRLIARQNPDGGWGWWSSTSLAGNISDPYITAYVLFGLGALAIGPTGFSVFCAGASWCWRPFGSG